MDVTELCVNCKKNISYTTYTRCWKTNAKKCPYFAPKTNAERIRSMSDEELAMLLYEIGYDGGWGALEVTLEWLRQPAKEADNETVGERKDGND